MVLKHQINQSLQKDIIQRTVPKLPFEFTLLKTCHHHLIYAEILFSKIISVDREEKITGLLSQLFRNENSFQKGIILIFEEYFYDGFSCIYSDRDL